MSEFTTIQITRELKDKLTVIKSATGKKYNDIIADLLTEKKEGEVVEDVITVNRDTVALSLKYWEYDKPEAIQSYDITFQELKLEPVGAVFTANVNPVGDFVNSVAEIVAKRGDDVILLVKEISSNNGKFSSISSVVHVNLF